MYVNPLTQCAVATRREDTGASQNAAWRRPRQQIRALPFTLNMRRSSAQLGSRPRLALPTPIFRCTTTFPKNRAELDDPRFGPTSTVTLTRQIQRNDKRKSSAYNPVPTNAAHALVLTLTEECLQYPQRDGVRSSSKSWQQSARTAFCP